MTGCLDDAAGDAEGADGDQEEEGGGELDHVVDERAEDLIAHTHTHSRTHKRTRGSGGGRGRGARPRG